MKTISLWSHFSEQVWTGEVGLPEAPVERQLEFIFRKFNCVDEEDAAFMERVGYDMPSLSIGDLVEFDGKTWAVANFGFLEIVQDTTIADALRKQSGEA